MLLYLQIYICTYIIIHINIHIHADCILSTNAEHFVQVIHATALLLTSSRIEPHDKTRASVLCTLQTQETRATSFATVHCRF